MSRLDELIKELCPDGVEYKKLSEIASISRGGNLQKKDLREEGIPCIHYGQIYTKYGLFADKTLSFISEEVAKRQKIAQPGDIVMAVTSENIDDVCKSVAWLGDKDVAVSGHTAIIHHNMDPKFLTYYFHSSHFFAQKVKLVHGTKVMEVTPDHLYMVSVPVPPLEVQREIVHILDHFTLLSAELSAELKDRKLQYEYYLYKLLTSQTNAKRLLIREIGPVCMCKRIMKSQTTTEGDVPFFKIGTFGGKPNAFISKETFEEYKSKYSYPKKGEVLISAAGTIGRTVVFDGKPSYFQDSNIVWVSNDETKVLNQYLYHYYKLNPWAISTGGTIARLYNDNILNAEIVVPSLEEQERIVSILDKFEMLCNDISDGLPAEIEARQKQYEYYRDKLLTFEEKKEA